MRRILRSSLSRVMGVATRRASVRIGVSVAVAVAVAVSAAVWSGTGLAGSRHLTKTPTVTTRKVGKLGVILVNSKGRTLYMFVPDKRKRVTCKGTCAVIWPPLKLKAGQKPTAGGAAKKSLLGSDKNPSGGRVVTYNGWPLYTYIRDTKPGQHTGQGIDNSGGLWYVLSPSGKVIKK
jgi:predicted lipoprotein with Yx(FWY)xxD motif